MDPFAQDPPSTDPFAADPLAATPDPFAAEPPQAPVQMQAQGDPFAAEPPSSDPFAAEPPPAEGDRTWLDSAQQLQDQFQQAVAGEHDRVRNDWMAGALASGPERLPVEDTRPVAEVLQAVFPEQSAKWTADNTAAARQRVNEQRGALSAHKPQDPGWLGSAMGIPSQAEGEAARSAELQRLDAASQAMGAQFATDPIKNQGLDPNTRELLKRPPPGPGFPPPGAHLLDPNRSTAAQMMGLGPTMGERFTEAAKQGAETGGVLGAVGGVGSVVGDLAQNAGTGLVQAVTALPMIGKAVVTDLAPPLVRDIVRFTGVGDWANELLGTDLPSGPIGESGAVVERAFAVMGEQLGHSAAGTVKDFYNPDTGEVLSGRQFQENPVETLLNTSVALKGASLLARGGAGAARTAAGLAPGASITGDLGATVARAAGGVAPDAAASSFARAGMKTAKGFDAAARGLDLAAAGIEPFTATARAVMGGAKLTSEAWGAAKGLPAGEGTRRLRAFWAAPSELMSFKTTLADGTTTTPWAQLQLRDAALARELLKIEKLHKGIPEKLARRVEEVLREVDPDLRFWFQRKDPEAWGGAYVPDHALLAAHSMKRVRSAEGGFETVPLAAGERAALDAALPPGWLDGVKAEFNVDYLASGDVKGVYRKGAPEYAGPGSMTTTSPGALARPGGAVNDANVVNLDPALPFAAEARLELIRAGAMAAKEGLLPEQIFYGHIGEYVPGIYRQWSKYYQEATGMEPLTGHRVNPSEFRVRGQRFMKAKLGKLSAADREMMGMIRDARQVLGQGLADIHLDVANLRLQKKMREMVLDDGVTPMAVSHETVKHNRHLKSSAPRRKGGSSLKGFGPLEDMWVPQEVGDFLVGMHTLSSDLGRLHDSMLSKWKWGKTVANMAGHFRQLIGNAVRADMAGSNPILYPVARQAYSGAIGELWRQEGHYYNRFLDAGGVSVQTLGIELSKQMAHYARNDPFVTGNKATLLPLAATTIAADLAQLGVKTTKGSGAVRKATAATIDAVRTVTRSTAARKAGNMGRAIIDAPGKAWQFSDTLFRYIRFKHITLLQEEFQRTGTITREMRRNMGADAERVLNARGYDAGLEAMREAKRIAGDYNDLAKAVRIVRRGAVPFIAYSWQAWPEMARFAREHPLQAAAYQQTFQGLQWFSALEGAPPEEIDAAMGEMDRLSLSRWSQQGSAFLGQRMAATEGGGQTPVSEYGNLAFYGPGGGAISGGGVTGDSTPSFYKFGHPGVALLNVLRNQDDQTGKEIVPGGKPGYLGAGTTANEWSDYFGPYLARGWLPETPLVPWSRSNQALSASGAFGGEPKGDWRGRIRTPGEALLAATTGWRTELVDKGSGADLIEQEGLRQIEGVKQRLMQHLKRKDKPEAEAEAQAEAEIRLIEEGMARKVREAQARAAFAKQLQDAHGSGR